MWRDVQPEEMQNKFDGNTAMIYGNDRSHFSRQLKFIEDRVLAGSIPSQRSGGTLPEFKIGLVDMYG